MNFCYRLKYLRLFCFSHKLKDDNFKWDFFFLSKSNHPNEVIFLAEKRKREIFSKMNLSKIQCPFNNDAWKTVSPNIFTFNRPSATVFAYFAIFQPKPNRKSCFTCLQMQKKQFPFFLDQSNQMKFVFN